MTTPNPSSVKNNIKNNIKRRSIFVIFLAALIMLFHPAASMAQDNDPVEQGERNAPDFKPAFPEQTRAPASNSGVNLSVETFAEPLEHPWGIDVLPDGSYIVTERPGRMRVISENGELSDPLEGVPEVVARQQGGLLDVRVSPDFSEDRLIYWSYSKPLDNGQSITAVARGKLSEDKSEVTEVEDIFEQEPPAPEPLHYGSRILFDEEYIYITTGERFTEENRQQSQQLDATYGKMIRLNRDGSVPEDNPFADQEDAVASIWSYGHRNMQGAAFQPENGNLWVIEHGPRGGDEMNLIEPGANYGWPDVAYGINYDGSPVGSGEARHDGDYTEPRYYWDPVIAPGGSIFYEGDMFSEWQDNLLISSLVPGGLVRIELDGDTVTGEERLLKDQGRVRDIMEAPDGSLLVLTDDPEGAVLRLTSQ